MDREICIFVSKTDLVSTINYNYKLFTELKERFNKITIINFIKIQKKKTKLKVNNFDNLGLKTFIPINNNEFIEFIKFKKIFAIDCLGKDFSFFNIRRLINKPNIHLILVINTGAISNESLTLSRLNFLNDFKNKIVRKIYRLLVFIKFFPSIDLYFDTRKDIIDNINSKIKKLSATQLKFKIFNFLYFKKCFRINCKSYDNYLLLDKKTKNKKIIFLDGNFRHPDIEKRNGLISESVQKTYFNNLEKVFREFEKKFNLPVDICLHPSSDQSIYEKFFKNRNVIKNRTHHEIVNSEIVLFHESSSVTDAIVQKKKIVSLETRLLGNYYFQRIINYKKLLNLFSINIDETFKINQNDLLQSFNKSLIKFEKYINNFIKSDNILSYKKISKILNKYVEQK